MLITALLIIHAIVGDALEIVNFNTPEYDTFLTADDFARGRQESATAESYRAFRHIQYNPATVPNVPQRLDLFEGDIYLGNFFHSLKIISFKYSN